MSDSISSLLKLAREGDRQSLNELIASYRPLLRLTGSDLARRVYRRRFDESDVVQRTCIEATASFGTFHGTTRDELNRWLYRILRNTLARIWEHHGRQKRDFRLDAVRDQGDQTLSFSWIGEDGTGPVTGVVRGEIALLVARALEQLPQDQRRVIEMMYIEDRKLVEITAALGITRGRAAGLIRRGLARLRRHLPNSLNSSTSNR